MSGSSADGKTSPGLPEIELEHQLQLALVDAFERAVGADERAEAGRILEQMADLSEMHFLAEELVMRLHQYPAFRAHAAEHARLMEEMKELLKENAAGQLDLTLNLAGRLRGTLASHLRSTDHELADYIHREGIAASAPGAPTH